MVLLGRFEYKIDDDQQASIPALQTFAITADRPIDRLAIEARLPSTATSLPLFHFFIPSPICMLAGLCRSRTITEPHTPASTAFRCTESQCQIWTGAVDFELVNGLIRKVDR